jgi:hypothetical protein
MYWHGFGSEPSEVLTGFGQAAIDQVVERGGVVAAFTAKLCATCGVADDVGWYVEDDPVSDQVVACAIAQAKIDPRHIHSLGFSAGALHSIHLALARSDYIASVVSYSGGSQDPAAQQEQDPSNHVAALLAYGRAGVDAVGIDFNLLAREWYDTVHPKGWYTLMCDHDGSHVVPTDLAPHVYRFLLDHPYKVEPEPYAAAIPAEFPAYCRNTLP